MSSASGDTLSLRRQLILYAALSFLAFWFLVPFVWMLITSVKTPDEVFSRLLPSVLRLANFVEIFKSADVAFRALLSQQHDHHGFWYGGESVYFRRRGLCLCPAEFFWPRRAVRRRAIDHDAARGGDHDPDVCALPEAGLGRYIPPFLVPACTGNAFQIFFLRQFFKTLPIDLIDAARIDGCSNLRICLSIAMPLAKPTLATLAILSFLSLWNDFMGPLIYLHSNEKRTLALGTECLCRHVRHTVASTHGRFRSRNRAHSGGLFYGAALLRAPGW